MKADGHTGKDIAKYLGVSRANLYRYLSAAASLIPAVERLAVCTHPPLSRISRISRRQWRSGR
jgi:hypothetical protein